MIDRDLADLYDVPTKRLNEQVKRNIARFPEDFAFQLTQEEFENWKSQIETSNSATKMGLRRRPYAFTEHGVLMLSSVLRSERAAEVNIWIMRTFVRLREILATHKELAEKINEHDQQIGYLFAKIEELLAPPIPPKKNPIGFVQPKGDE